MRSRTSRKTLELLAEQAPGGTDYDPEHVLDHGHALYGLTGAQEAYVQHLLSGVSQTDAYRMAYNCEGAKPETIMRVATDVSRNPKVVARVRMLMQQRSQQTSLVVAITRENIASGIASIAMDVHAKHADRLRGYELLGKIAGIDLFKHDKDKAPAKDMTIEEIEAALAARLAQLKDITPKD